MGSLDMIVDTGVGMMRSVVSHMAHEELVELKYFPRKRNEFLSSYFRP
jgi:hypothetical protein